MLSPAYGVYIYAESRRAPQSATNVHGMLQSSIGRLANIAISRSSHIRLLRYTTPKPTVFSVLHAVCVRACVQFIGWVDWPNSGLGQGDCSERQEENQVWVPGTHKGERAAGCMLWLWLWMCRRCIRIYLRSSGAPAKELPRLSPLLQLSALLPHARTDSSASVLIFLNCCLIQTEVCGRPSWETAFEARRGVVAEIIGRPPGCDIPVQGVVVAWWGGERAAPFPGDVSDDDAFPDATEGHGERQER